MADASSKTTIDHDEIRTWVEERGGRPAVVRATETEDSGLLRIDFAEDDDALGEVTWDEFFRIFDDNELAFLYQDETKDGATSRFFKFVRRESG